MAQPADSLFRQGATGAWKRLLAPYPGRAAIAARVALICALTVLVTSACGTPEAALSAYVVFFLNRPDRVMSLVTGLAMLMLVTVVIGLVLVVAVFVLDDPLWRVACIAMLSLGLLFVTSASKLRPVGAILAMIVGFSLDKLGSVPFGEVATRAMLYAWLMVAIPVGLSIAVNLAVAPSPRRLLCRELARRLRLAARSLAEPAAMRDALHACLTSGDDQIASWIRLSVVDGSSAAADVPALRQAASSTIAILVAADLAGSEPSGRLPAALIEPIARTLEDMAGMLEAGGYPVDIELALPETGDPAPLARAVAQQLLDAINRFAVVDTAAPVPAAGKRGAFFLPDAFTNPDHVRYALKTTVAAMFCYLLYSQLDWPGIHTCFITVYMVSLGTTAETVEKLTLRIAGCLVGAILGTAAILLVMPALTSAGELMGVVFAGACLSAWIAFGSPRIAYAGFQIAFAFFLCVIQGAAPGFDLTLARDRTIGILLGNIVVYLVFTRVWPVSVAARVDARLAELRQHWERLAALAHPATRRAQAANAMARRDSLEQDLALMDYEPSWVRPTAAWVSERRRELARLSALEGPMFLLAERQPGEPAIDHWLRRLGGTRSPQSAGTAPARAASSAAPDPASPYADAGHTRTALLNLGDARLAGLEPIESGDAGKEHTTHAPA
ncbi:FUSC family protein [Cupriavidus basilensis]|uniref:FUSC family protein n=1 Tax=Cupriavidus basilensis TaxID=68895 RepID=A0ABT6AKT8_9BURK|nr:FUSC family protein [Cupriavidus basilensis]MDF3832932.1 FUSC family protein [Cupriavidus basilensis]